jgi:hypothetical protein
LLTPHTRGCCFKIFTTKRVSSNWPNTRIFKPSLNILYGKLNWA